MTAPLILLVCLAGGAGSVCRMLLDSAIRQRTGDTPTPWGTIAINLSGSFALGLIAGLAAATLLPDGARAVAGTGFLGGFTTFSTASFETVRLLQGRRVRLALGYAFGMLALGTALAALGLCLGASLAR